MRGTHAIGLVLIGAIVFVGLSAVVLLDIVVEYWEFWGIVLAAAVPIAILLLGFFLGFFYGIRAVQSRPSRETAKRFRRALDFERQQRRRLERTLEQTRVEITQLEESLKFERLSSKKNENKESELAGELGELEKRCKKLSDDLSLRKERIADLQAELSVARTDLDQAKSQQMGRSQIKLDQGSVKEVLGNVIALDGVQTALIADDHGLLIESAGSLDGQKSSGNEVLAAVSSRLIDLDPRLREILPLEDVATMSLGDESGLVIDVTYFELLGMQCSLSITRDRKSVYPELADQVIEAIRANLTE